MLFELFSRLVCGLGNVRALRIKQLFGKCCQCLFSCGLHSSRVATCAAVNFLSAFMSLSGPAAWCCPHHSLSCLMTKSSISVLSGQRTSAGVSHTICRQNIIRFKLSMSLIKTTLTGKKWEELPETLKTTERLRSEATHDPCLESPEPSHSN